MVVAIDAVTNGWRELWLVAAVAMPRFVVAAPAAPQSVAASLTLNRSDRKAAPKPSSSPWRTSSSSGAGVDGPPASP